MWLPSPVDHRHQLLLQELKAFVVNATVLPSELGTWDWKNWHWEWDFHSTYPLVNIQKTMENHHAINGKLH